MFYIRTDVGYINENLVQTETLNLVMVYQLQTCSLIMVVWKKNQCRSTPICWKKTIHICKSEWWSIESCDVGTVFWVYFRLHVNFTM